jgi:hypothetical protein
VFGDLNLTTGQRYKFAESINNFFMNLWHQLWKNLSELFSDDSYVIWIVANLFSEGVFDLK